jgi:hypothetical protein
MNEFYTSEWFEGNAWERVTTRRQALLYVAGRPGVLAGTGFTPTALIRVLKPMYSALTPSSPSTVSDTHREIAAIAGAEIGVVAEVNVTSWDAFVDSSRLVESVKLMAAIAPTALLGCVEDAALRKQVTASQAALLGKTALDEAEKDRLRTDLLGRVKDHLVGEVLAAPGVLMNPSTVRGAVVEATLQEASTVPLTVKTRLARRTDAVEADYDWSGFAGTDHAAERPLSTRDLAKCARIVRARMPWISVEDAEDMVQEGALKVALTAGRGKAVTFSTLVLAAIGFARDEDAKHRREPVSVPLSGGADDDDDSFGLEDTLGDVAAEEGLAAAAARAQVYYAARRARVAASEKVDSEETTDGTMQIQMKIKTVVGRTLTDRTLLEALCGKAAPTEMLQARLRRDLTPVIANRTLRAQAAQHAITMFIGTLER